MTWSNHATQGYDGSVARCWKMGGVGFKLLQLHSISLDSLGMGDYPWQLSLIC